MSFLEWLVYVICLAGGSFLIGYWLSRRQDSR